MRIVSASCQQLQLAATEYEAVYVNDGGQWQPGVRVGISGEPILLGEPIAGSPASNPNLLDSGGFCSSGR